MGKKQVFHTEKAAVTGGPYSQAIIHDGLIYTAGQGAIDPETNQIRLGTVEEEAELALAKPENHFGGGRLFPEKCFKGDRISA